MLKAGKNSAVRGFFLTRCMLWIWLILHLAGGPCLGNNPGINPHIYKNIYYRNYWLVTADFTKQRDFVTPVELRLQQPYFSSGLFFRSKKNFDLSLAGSVAINSDSTFSKAAGDLLFTAGYTWEITPRFSIRPSLVQQVYSKNSHYLFSLFSNVLQIDINYRGSVYQGGIYGGYWLGDKNTFYTSVKNGTEYFFTLPRFEKIWTGIAIESYVNFSDMHFYNELLYRNWSADEFASWASEYENVPVTSVMDLIERSGLDDIKDYYEYLLSESDPQIFGRAYGITSFQLDLPLTLIGGKWSGYLIPAINIPLSHSMFYEQTVQFLISAGIALIIN